MRTLKEISHDSFYKMGDYHQITIDFIEETENLFDDKPENKEEQTDLICKLQALYYNIDICLEVFNPEFKIEIDDLTNILSLIEIRTGYVQSLEFKSV